MTIAAADILEQLDGTDFPDLDNGYYYPVDVRLHAFRDDRRWALVIETVGYSPRVGNLEDVLHVFGNCLTQGEPGMDNADFLERVDNWDEIEDVDEPETYAGGPLVVRGTAIELGAARGAELVDVFRLLTPAHREALLADEAELRRRIPADLPEILRLDEWRQPVDDELPSECATFQQLAEVLATGDATRYRPSPVPNTHWTHWPEAGTL
ncbi:hypothetical protein AB0J82_04850 [Asanoa sp. NPDC049518]|uniref:DUF7003 family protein n=1 Tax=unclassified Asanoa TaxID=2685164 RepID=UPI003443D383